jgi:O-antigen/teichoic acid export membrane protein
MSSATGSGRDHSVARNASSAYLFRVVYGAIVLGLTTYLFRRLGNDGFGTYSVYLSLATVFSVLEISFSNGIAKILSELHGAGREDDVRRTIAAAVSLATGLGAVGLVVSVAIAVFASDLAAAGQDDELRTGMLVLGAIMFVRLPCMVYGATLMGAQRYDLYNVARIVAALAWGLGTITAVEAGAGLGGAILATAGYMLVEALLWVVQMRRMDPALPLWGRGEQRSGRRGLAAFSSYLLVADASVFAGQRIQPVVIAAVRDAATASPFAAGVKLQTALQSLVAPFVDLLLPMVSELHGRGARSEVVARLSLATRAAMQITFPVAACFALFSSDIVDAWLGADAPGSTAAVISVLMCSQFLTLTATPAAKVLIAVGRVRIRAATALAEGLISFVLTIVLVSEYGATGAAWAILIAGAVVAPAVLPLACRACGEPLRNVLAASFVPALLSSAPGIAAMVLVRVAMPDGTARFGAGFALGVGLSVAIGLAQVGRGRLRSIRAEVVAWRGAGEPPSEI